MIKPIPPCRDCEERYGGCHGKCDGYKTFRKELDEYNELKRNQTLIQQDIDGYEIDRARKKRVTYGRKS